jgi:hypothetical protein
MDPDSSLTDLFKSALADASRASNLPTVEDDTQVPFTSLIVVLASYSPEAGFESIRT